jgi:hypothetical protein
MRRLIAVLALAAALPSTARAQVIQGQADSRNRPPIARAGDYVWGRAVRVYADPSDLVVELDRRGPCGTSLYHFRRANANFDEVVALVLTAFAADKSIGVFVPEQGCAGDRNIGSHAAIER